MPGLSLREAAKQANVSKSTILRAVRNGRLSAARTEYGGYRIDPAELFRVYEPRGRVMKAFAAGLLAAVALIVGYQLPHQSKLAVTCPAVAPLVTGPAVPIPNSMAASNGSGLDADTSTAPRRIDLVQTQAASETSGPGVSEPGGDATGALRGNEVTANTDLLGARLQFQRAAEAALAIAGRYDPFLLERLGERGLAPDVALARFWYEKARELGSKEAPQRLERLASQANWPEVGVWRWSAASGLAKR